MISKLIRVLVVDDSAVVRGLLARALETDSEITVCGTAMHGEAALKFMHKEPVDVVILDIEMPVMDGLTALKRIQAEFPGTRVVMASSLTYQGAETTIEALSLGAAGCIAKPQAKSTAESIEQLVRELVPLVCALGRPKTAAPFRNAASPRTAATSPNAIVRPVVQPSILVIGSSTGGPQALREVLTGLPANFSLPTVIVQHMPPLFTPMLANHLEKDTGRPTIEAIDGGLIERGHTYVAPGGYHVVIDKHEDRMVTTLNQNEPEHYCRPSVNTVFRSAAEWYGKTVLAVMLTGMGDDGIEGTRLVVENEGYVIAQDESTSVVWGMPGAVVRKNLANEVLPLEKIGPAIHQICSREFCRT